MASENDQSILPSESMPPVRRFRHRHRLLSCLALVAVPVLLILTVANWRYRFEFQEGRGIELPKSKKQLNNWVLSNPQKIEITKENKETVLELRSTGEGEVVSAIYRLPDMEAVDFIRVTAEMRCLGQHDAAAWRRGRINLLGFDKTGKPLYKYPYQLGLIKDSDQWEIEDSVFRLADEAEYYEVQILNQKTTLLQVKRLKVLAARERVGVASYRNVSVLLGIFWVVAVGLVARAYGGARKWWRAVAVACVLLIGFSCVVYPAIKRPVRPPLSRKFHDWVSFEWKAGESTAPTIKPNAKTENTPAYEHKPENKTRTSPAFSWLREEMSGAHALLYAGLTLAICILAWSCRAAWMAGAMALLQEGRQTWIDNNTDLGDIWDLTMDALGILIGITGYLIFRYLIFKRVKRWVRETWKDQA